MELTETIEIKQSLKTFPMFCGLNVEPGWETTIKMID